MHIFVISPYKETKDLTKQSFLKNRLNRLFNRLKKAGLFNPELSLSENNIKIIGVNGEDYDSNLNVYLSDNWRKTYLKFLKGSQGSALSHIKILQFIKDNNIQEDVLILEDDALINENFKNFIPKKFPDDYDVLVMHPAENIYPKQTYQYSENIRKITNFDIKPVCIYTYFVNGRKISQILDTLLPLEWQMDICMTNNPKFNTYIYDDKLNLSGQETIHDNELSIDSYARELNKYSKYFFMEFVNQEKVYRNIGDNFIFELLCHCTMLHATDINRNYSFWIEEEIDKNIFKKVENIVISHDWFDNIIDQDYQKLFLKIKNSQLLKHNVNYKFVVKYTEGFVDEKKKYITRSKDFTY